ncbi:MAG: hypothetical protein JST60_06460, partial [Chloroflexi bacterium SZAS-1]|nr:hypothetical protein [Chloroflexi bacterium SZAS-1]
RLRIARLGQAGGQTRAGPGHPGIHQRARALDVVGPQRQRRGQRAQQHEHDQNHTGDDQGAARRRPGAFGGIGRRGWLARGRAVHSSGEYSRRGGGRQAASGGLGVYPTTDHCPSICRQSSVVTTGKDVWR